MVFATFALGTSLGDFTANTLRPGFLMSGILFAAVFAIPVIARRTFGMNEVVAFWFAYVVTRPRGASFADWVTKPRSLRGLGHGDAPTAILIAGAISLFVTHLTPSASHAGDAQTSRRILANPNTRE